VAYGLGSARRAEVTSLKSVTSTATNGDPRRKRKRSQRPLRDRLRICLTAYAPGGERNDRKAVCFQGSTPSCTYGRRLQLNSAFMPQPKGRDHSASHCTLTAQLRQPTCSSRTLMSASSRAAWVTPKLDTTALYTRFAPDNQRRHEPAGANRPQVRRRRPSGRGGGRGPGGLGGCPRPLLRFSDIFRDHGPAWRRANPAM